MTRREVEQKIIEIAHEFAKRYGEEVLELNDYELIAYITP
jgi:urease gamma subunit